MQTVTALKLTMLIILLLVVGLIWFGSAQAETMATDILFEETQVNTSSAGATASGTTVTITQPGEYTLSGACSQGQVVVDADGDVVLRLAGLTLTSPNGPVVDIRDADTATLWLVPETQNTLADSPRYEDQAEEQDAAIFSKADLVIGGSGTLHVKAMYNDGISSRDTLLVEGGNLIVEAAKHGIKGKDYLIIRGGSVQVTAGGDGLKATNDAQEGLGYVEIHGGTFSIQCSDQGISAVTRILIHDGQIQIATPNDGMKAVDTIEIKAGSIDLQVGDDSFAAGEVNISPDVVVSQAKW